MIKLLSRRDISIFLTILWMGVIFYLSHQTSSTSSQLSSGFSAFIVNFLSTISINVTVEQIHFFVRKGAHFSAYYILGFILFHTMRLGRKITIRLFFGALFISVIYAASDEIHQLFIPGRSGEIRDVIIDSFGSLTGIVTYILIFRLVHLLYNK